MFKTLSRENLNINNILNLSYLKRFTMDTIWNCAFGLDIDLQNNPNNEYLKNSEKTFSNATQPPFISVLSRNILLEKPNN